jgi:hypothetical protein
MEPQPGNKINGVVNKKAAGSTDRFFYFVWLRYYYFVLILLQFFVLFSFDQFSFNDTNIFQWPVTVNLFTG